jgi:hypothetical protein
MSALLAAEAFARAAAEVFATLLERMHPAWAQAMGLDQGKLAGAAPSALGSRAVWAEAVAARLDLSAAKEPLQLLWLLPPSQIRRVCSARMVFTCRGALARSVDAQARRSARALVGAAAFEALIAVPAQRSIGVSALAALEAGFTDIDGFALLQAGSSWSDARAQRLVQLVLPPAQTVAEAPVRCDAEHALFSHHFPTIFPEHAWLFGSNLAHTTSV